MMGRASMRHEFKASTKKAARMRSGGVCEARGARYGFEPATRCTVILSETKVEFDHYPLGAHAEGSNTLENCVCTCQRCNQYAANHTDKAAEAKIKRRRKKAGLDPITRKPKQPIRSRGFQQGSRPFPSKPFNKERS